MVEILQEVLLMERGMEVGESLSVERITGSGQITAGGQVMAQVQVSFIYIKVVVKVLAVEIITATQKIIKIKQHGN
jgi:hypothetical protein